ncbi:MAG: NCS2 family permease [Acidobacteria bacterium]|nr:MAG: NCS2 family permease [Acidobacteriota bacterium]
MGLRERIDRLFAISARGSSVRTEVIGGIVTFFTMAYIIVVNPAVLRVAGLPEGPSTVATIVVAVLGTLLMALLANRPIAIAPYMGENAFVAYTVVVALGFTWRQGLTAVFLAGVLFAAITVLGVRGRLANAIPASLKISFGVGIGLFLAFIGLYETGIVTSAAAGLPPEALVDAGTGRLTAPAVPVRIGNLADPLVLLAVGGFTLIVVLMALRVRGAMLIGIAASGIAAIGLGAGELPRRVVAMPFVGEYSLAPIAFRLDFGAVFEAAFVPVLLTIFLMAFLDTVGTLIGVGAAGGMLDEDGNFPDIERPMLADALASVAAGLVGTTTAGAYIESATGIEEGARTGLAALVTAAAFALSLPFIPLFAPIQDLACAWGPPLIVVGILMMRQVARLPVGDLTELVPAVATILMIAFTWNIANGMMAGLVLWPALKTITGRAREVRAEVWVLGALSALYFAFGLTH